MTFLEAVQAWLERRQPGRSTEVTEVRPDGTDWDGDAESGFRSSFSVEVHYIGTDDKPHWMIVEGDDMASLWTDLMNGWSSL